VQQRRRSEVDKCERLACADDAARHHQHGKKMAYAAKVRASDSSTGVMSGKSSISVALLGFELAERLLDPALVQERPLAIHTKQAGCSAVTACLPQSHCDTRSSRTHHLAFVLFVFLVAV